MPYYYYPTRYGYGGSGLWMLLICAAFAMWASWNVNSTFKKYAKQFSRRGLTGAQAAQRVLSANGVTGVRIERVGGSLTDHFDPKTNVIRLSDSVYDSASTAAIGVACHEAGHAVQYAHDYAPIRLRAAIIPVTNFGTKIAWPLMLLGVLLSSMSYAFYNLVYVGIACFSLSLVFQLITLPVEFNASRRAVRAIEEGGILYEDELVGAKKTLRAAALTYVAAAATSLVQLLRLIAIYGGRRRRN